MRRARRSAICGIRVSMTKRIVAMSSGRTNGGTLPSCDKSSSVCAAVLNIPAMFFGVFMLIPNSAVQSANRRKD